MKRIHLVMFGCEFNWLYFEKLNRFVAFEMYYYVMPLARLLLIFYVYYVYEFSFLYQRQASSYIIKKFL